MSMIFVWQNVSDVLTKFYSDLHNLDVTYLWFRRPELTSRGSLKIFSACMRSGVLANNGDKNRLNMEVKYFADISALPHMELVVRAGEKLINLQLSMSEDLTQRRSSDTTFACNGSYLDSIFQNCPNLQHLLLFNTFLISYNSDLPIKQSLKGGKLILCRAFVGPDYLSALSLRCPHLYLLELSDSSFVYLNGVPVKEPNNIVINMPSTEFQEIKWCTDEGDAIIFYLKIMELKSGKVLYVKGDGSNLNKCNEEDYQQSLKYNSNLSIYVQCQAVRDFCIITPGISQVVAMEIPR